MKKLYSILLAGFISLTGCAESPNPQLNPIQRETIQETPQPKKISDEKLRNIYGILMSLEYSGNEKTDELKKWVVEDSIKRLADQEFGGDLEKTIESCRALTINYADKYGNNDSTTSQPELEKFQKDFSGPLLDYILENDFEFQQLVTTPLYM